MTQTTSITCRRINEITLLRIVLNYKVLFVAIANLLNFYLIMRSFIHTDFHGNNHWCHADDGNWGSDG